MILPTFTYSGQLSVRDFQQYFEESDDSDFDYPVDTVRPPRILFPPNINNLVVSNIY